MKSIYSALLALVLVLGASNAYANTGIYLGAKMGASITRASDATITNVYGENSDTDTVFGGGVAVGYDFNSNFNLPIRAELEWLMFASATGSGSDFYSQYLDMDYGVNTLMANVYYDFNTNTRLTPYVTAGLGFAFIDTDVSGNFLGTHIGGGDGSDTNFAWSLGLGLGFDITDNLTIDAGYKFMSLGSSETDNLHALGTAINNVQIETDNVYANFFHVGVRFTF